MFPAEAQVLVAYLAIAVSRTLESAARVGLESSAGRFLLHLIRSSAVLVVLVEVPLTKFAKGGQILTLRTFGNLEKFLGLTDCRA